MGYDLTQRITRSKKLAKRWSRVGSMNAAVATGMVASAILFALSVLSSSPGNQLGTASAPGSSTGGAAYWGVTIEDATGHGGSSRSRIPSSAADGSSASSSGDGSDTSESGEGSAVSDTGTGESEPTAEPNSEDAGSTDRSGDADEAAKDRKRALEESGE